MDYEQFWRIPDWNRVQFNTDLLASQILEFQTGKSPRTQITWMVGLKLDTRLTRFRTYWQLIDAKRFPEEKVQATLTSMLLTSQSSVHICDTREKVMILGQTVEASHDLPYKIIGWEGCINEDGEFVFKLKLTIMEPTVEHMMKMFHKNCVTSLCANFTSILNDESTADIKILTSEHAEIFAHKAILKGIHFIFSSY